MPVSYYSKEGISKSAGWFHLEFTSVPSKKQMKKLRSQIGSADALAPPDHWDKVQDQGTGELRPVDGEEFETVSKFFKQALRPVNGEEFEALVVQKVERVQNLSLWQSFALKRLSVLQRKISANSIGKTLSGSSLAKSNKRNSRNMDFSSVECAWLFHGTTEDIVPKIIQQGFNRSFSGERNAAWYGKGVYFARDASYSADQAYSEPDSHGVQRMFLCRVVVGAFCQGKKDAVSPDSSDGLSLYDTTVDNPKDPSIYVTYHDAQAYPEYVLYFKR
jgi:poly [ADP-ribose] polymerase 10/14/15